MWALQCKSWLYEIAEGVLDILCVIKNCKSIYKNVSVISVLRRPAHILQVRYVFSMISLHILMA